MRWLGSTTYSMDMSLSKLWEIVKDRGSWSAAVHGATKSWKDLATQQQTWEDSDGGDYSEYFQWSL